MTVLARLRSHAPMKVALGAVLIVAFAAGYAYVQRWPIRDARPPVVTAVDRLVPFSPAWVWPYLSLYPLTAAAWLATTRAELWRYAGGFLAVLAVALACFLLWPIASPRPAALPDAAVFEAMRWLDLPTNTAPSLHVAFAAYHARLVGRVAPVPAWGRAALWAWVAVIAYATLATKQHSAVDVPTGAALGLAGDWLAWRGASRPARRAT